jgi:hypothetical protein
MNHTLQALMAIRLLQSLPNWDRVACVYGDVEGYLADLASDLENHDWEELVIDDAKLAEYKADHAWIEEQLEAARQAMG